MINPYDPYEAEREVWRSFDRAAMYGEYDPEDGDEPDLRWIYNGKPFRYTMRHVYITGLPINAMPFVPNTIPAKVPYEFCFTDKPLPEEMQAFPRWRFVPCKCGLALWRIR